MALAIPDLKARILRILKKSPNKQGQYTDDRILDAINDAADLVSTEEQIAGEGFFSNIVYIDAVADQRAYDLPTNIVLINQVRYKVGNVYVPIQYDENRRGVDSVDASGASTPHPYYYRIVNNQMYFDPPLQTSETDAIQIEGTFFPLDFISSDLSNASAILPLQFSRAAEQFIKYAAASILSKTSGSVVQPWADLEARWYQKMLTLIKLRNNQTQYINNFEG